MEIVNSILSGFIGSLLVVLFLYRLKPKLEISQYIAKDDSSEFIFKISNKTPYPVLDVNVQLYIATPQNIPNGSSNHLKEVSSTKMPEMDSHQEKNQQFGKELFFTCSNKLDSNWNDKNQHLMLVVSSRHSLSQFSSVTKRKFYTKGSTIREGKFESGKNMDVVQNA